MSEAGHVASDYSQVFFHDYQVKANKIMKRFVTIKQGKVYVDSKKVNPYPAIALVFKRHTDLPWL